MRIDSTSVTARHNVLPSMADVERMERRTLCQMTGRSHYNHPTWRDGRNEVRYVPQHEVADLKTDIAGHQLFITLAEHYAGEAIRITRLRRQPTNEPKTPNLEIRKSGTIRCGGPPGATALGRRSRSLIMYKLQTQLCPRGLPMLG